MDNNRIEIVDVIHNYSRYSESPQIFVVLSRLPAFVYERRSGGVLVGSDDCVFDFLQESPGTKDAFAGQVFEIKLSDGGTLKCAGQVWSVGPPKDFKGTISAGCGTVESLKKCNVFRSCRIDKAKYAGWMANNTPSYNYEKYSLMENLEYWDRVYLENPSWDRPVSPARARVLKRKGVTIRRHQETGGLGWSRQYEARKAEILDRARPDYKGRFHPDNRTV